MNPIDAELLGATAHRILVADLHARGNVLSALHSNALRVLVDAMAAYSAETLYGRHAVALPTGMGKTSAVVALILAAEELGYVIPVSVATSRVEALCNIKRELVARGVSEERIGLKHAKTDPSLLPSTGNEDRRYMLVTHARVNFGSDYALFGTHKGLRRPLTVWDETMMRSESVGIEVRKLKAAVASLSVYADRSPELYAGLAYVRECLAAVDTGLAGLRERGDPDALGAPLVLPERTELELRAYARAAESSPVLKPYVDTFADFLVLSQDSLGVLAVGTAEGVIWQRETIPELLRNVLVLDASYPIRSLVKLDPEMQELTTYAPEALKRFDDVEVVQLMAAGGRSSIVPTKRQSREEQSAVIAEVVAICRAQWETCRGILVFTFKQRKGEPDHNAELRTALRIAGMDPETLIDSGEKDDDGKPILREKVQGLTFGMETSINGLEFCDVVILAGVLHRSELDIAAAMKGQLGSLHAPTPSWKVNELIQSEVAHVCYQALSRGACRRITDGRAHRMKAFLVHRSKNLRKALETVMPGVAYEFRKPVHLKPANKDDVSEDMAAAILGHLRTIPEGIDSVSCRSVCAALAVANTEAAKQAFTRGGRLLEDLGGQWVKVGAAFRRNADRYGFSDTSVKTDSP